jgi:peptidoglycan glycosyltransferase
MEMCLISATVANNGTMMKPYLIDRIENASGNIVSTTSPKELRDIMSSDEVSTMKTLMRSVITQGTARSAFRRATNFEAYGKTGTAEFNSSKDTHSWFTGFGTDGDRTIAVCVILEDTKLYASNSAYQIMSAYFNN